MKFLVISQRAIPSSNFNLKDLTGHGRIDIIFRTILAATRQLLDQKYCEIYCYLKGGVDTANRGWIKWQQNSDHLNEISLASQIKENWNQVFTRGTLHQLINQIQPEITYLLDEDGIEVNEIEFNTQIETLVVLGAQKDLTREDLDLISIDKKIKLSNESLLASHAIILWRQLTYSL